MAIHHDYSGGLPASTVAGFARELSEANEKAKSAQGSARNVRKRMEEYGIDLKAFDLAKRLSGLDATDAINRINKAYFYLKAMHAPVGAQLSFIEMVDDNSLTDGQRLQKWYDEGFSAGVSGKWEKDCPHAVHMPAGQRWLEGYRDAQATLAEKFVDGEKQAEEPKGASAGTDAEPVAPAPRRRGRPPGSGKKGQANAIQKTAAASAGATPNTVQEPPPAPDLGPIAPPAPDPEEEVAFSEDDGAPPFDAPLAPPIPPTLLN